MTGRRDEGGLPSLAAEQDTEYGYHTFAEPRTPKPSGAPVSFDAQATRKKIEARSSVSSVLQDA